MGRKVYNEIVRNRNKGHRQKERKTKMKNYEVTIEPRAHVINANFKERYIVCAESLQQAKDFAFELFYEKNWYWGRGFVKVTAEKI